MADSFIKITVQMEVLGLKPGSGGSSGGPGAAAPGGSFNLPVDEVKAVFDSLVTNIRTLNQTIEQTQRAFSAVQQAQATLASNVPSAPPPTPAPPPPQPTRPTQQPTQNPSQPSLPGIGPTPPPQPQAPDPNLQAQAAAAAAAAQAAGQVTDIQIALAKAYQSAASAAAGVVITVDNVREALVELSSEKRSTAGRIQTVVNPIVDDNLVRERANKVRQANPNQFFEIDPNLGPNAHKRVQETLAKVDAAIKVALLEQDSGDLSKTAGKRFSELGNRVNEIVKEIDDISGVKFKKNEFGASFRAQQAVGLGDQIKAQTVKVADAQTSGDAGALTSAKAVLDQLVHDFVNILRTEAGNANRGTFDNLKDPQGGGSRSFSPLIASEVGIATPSNSFNKIQKDVIDMVKATIQLDKPLTVAHQLFKILAGDLDNFEENLRQIRLGLKDVAPAEVGGQENFQKLQELRGLADVRRSRTGVLQGPGAVLAETSASFNVAEINRLRQAAASNAPGSRPTTKTLNFTDDAGNVKRVTVELKQLGTTLDSVRIKAKEVSDNMFDKASVRTALNRVAIWGAASGIIFGALSAFKTGVNTIVETEASIVTLGKVLNSAQVDFDAFKVTATATAVGLAQTFGQPLKEVIQTMITFSQQGKTFAETVKLTEAASLAANVTTLNAPEAASALTAATAQFGIPIEQASSIVDKFNNVSNNAAVTETALAEALKRAGNAAVNAGVDLDQFNGIVAAISEQTRQSGSEIGAALKFVFARINTPEAEKGLARIGVSIRDAEGSVKPFVDILGELKNAFEGLNDTQKTQAAISVAGAHRFNTFLALVQNFDRFQESAADSANSAGSALREQEKIAETAAFKIQQLKNAASEAAISFGSFLSPALKGATDIAKAMLNVVSGIPDIFKIVGVSGGLATIAFVKLGDQMVSLIDLFDKTNTGGAGVLATLGRGLSGPAQTVSQQLAFKPAEIASRADVGGAESGVILSRTVADFGLGNGKKAADEFAAALDKGKRVLIDQDGQIVKNSANFTKFSAISRGFSTGKLNEVGEITERSALGIAALNSGFTRLIATIVKMSAFVTRLTGFGFAFDAIEKSVTGASAATVTFGLNILRVIGAGAAIFLVVKAIQKIGDAISESGESNKKALGSEIATRTEAIAAIEKQRREVEKLAKARVAAALNAAKADIEDPALRDERIRRGGFKDPGLDARRLQAQETQANNVVGFANPQLISGVDEFGNAILRSAASFDVLAASAASAEKSVLAATQVKVIEGFVKDLQPASGAKDFFGTAARGLGGIIDLLPGVDGVLKDTGLTIGDKIARETQALQALLDDPKVKEAAALGIDVRFLDEDFGKKLDEQARKLQAAGVDFKGIMDTIRSEISKLPEDTGELLLRSDKIKIATELEARRLTTETGTPTTGQEVRQQLLLKNRSSLKGVQGLIGTSAEETLGNFNEKGILEKVVNVRDDVAASLKAFKGGELIVSGLLGDNQQIQVVVDEFGNRLGVALNDATGKIELRSLAELIDTSVGQIKFFDPKVIKQQIDSIALEISRVTSGGARGSLLDTDLDLGTLRKFEATGQQLASQKDSPLLRDLFEARKNTQKLQDQFKQDAEEGSTTPVSGATVSEFNKLAIEQDTLESIFKFNSLIEDVGRSFNKALDDIDSNELKDSIKSKFSGVLGAAAGGIEARANAPLLESELNAQQLKQLNNPNLNTATNRLVDTEKATGVNVADRVDLARNISLATREFTAAQAKGAIRDPAGISALFREAQENAAGGATAAENIMNALQKNTLNEAQQQTKLQQELVNLMADPEALSAGIVAASQRAVNDPTARAELQNKVKDLSSETANKLSPLALTELSRALGPENTPAAVSDALARRNAEVVAGKIGNTLLRIAPKKDEDGKVNLFDGIKRVPIVESPKVVEEQKDTLSRIFADAVSKPGEITPQLAEGVVKEVINAFKNSELPELREKGASIEEQFNAGNITEIIRDVERGLQGARQVPRSDTSDPANQKGRTVEGRNSEIQFSTKVFEAVADGMSALQAPLKRILTGFNILADVANNLLPAIRDNFKNARDTIGVGRELGGLGASSQAGALAGIIGTNFDLGKSEFKDGKNNLTGQDVAQIENQNLVKTGNDLGVVFGSIKSNIELAKKAEIKLQEVRKEALLNGDTTVVAETDRSLAGLTSILAKLNGQAQNASKGMFDLGQSLRNIEAVNQLSIDVENLISTFRRAQEFEVDTTSIDTALGKTPFSRTRATFEQFQQGQGGDLTKSERELADVEFKQRSGQISAAEAANAKKGVEFNKDEDLIAFAQGKENQKFQNEVNVAQQILGKLVDFSGSAGPGAGQAEELARILQEELGSAGDIIDSNRGTQTVRDPRTGQNVNVPASDVKQFRGVESLDDIKEKLKALAAQVKNEEQTKQATLISDPIVAQLQTTQTEIVSAINDMAQSTENSSAVAKAEEDIKAVTALGETLNKFVESFTTIFSGFSDSLKETLGPLASIFGGAQKKASGGLISGPGGPREDRVPIMASPGEFVVNAASVRKLGIPFLHSINGSGAPATPGAGAGGLRFASGGLVPNAFGLEVEEDDADKLAASIRGKEIRFQGPTPDGKPLGIVTEDELEARKIAALESRIASLPTDERIAELNAAARERGLKRKKLGKGLIFDQAHPGTNVMFDENGKTILTNAETGIPLNRDAIGVDFTSFETFKSDSDRKAKLAAQAIDRDQSIEARKATEERRIQRIRGDFSALKLGEVSDLTQLGIQNRTASFTAEVMRHVNVLRGLSEKMNTPEGREFLSQFQKTAQNDYLESSIALERLIGQAGSLEKRPIQVNHPVNKTLETLLDANFGETGFVTDKGEVIGDVFDANNPIFEELRSGSVRELIRKAQIAASYASKSNENFSAEQRSALADHVNTSIDDSFLGEQAKAFANFGIGLGGGATESIGGFVKLPSTLTKAGGALGESLEEFGVGGTAKRGGAAAIEIGKAVKDRAKQTTRGLFSSDATDKERTDALLAFGGLTSSIAVGAVGGAASAPGRLAALGLVKRGFGKVGAIGREIGGGFGEARGILKNTDARGKAGLGAKQAVEEAKAIKQIEAEVKAATDAAKAPSAGVPTMMTRKMKQQLIDLGHSSDAIKNMTPQQAFDAINAGPPGIDVDGLSGTIKGFKGNAADVEDLASNSGAVLSAAEVKKLTFGQRAKKFGVNTAKAALVGAGGFGVASAVGSGLISPLAALGIIGGAAALKFLPKGTLGSLKGLFSRGAKAGAAASDEFIGPQPFIGPRLPDLEAAKLATGAPTGKARKFNFSKLEAEKARVEAIRVERQVTTAAGEFDAKGPGQGVVSAGAKVEVDQSAGLLEKIEEAHAAILAKIPDRPVLTPEITERLKREAIARHGVESFESLLPKISPPGTLPTSGKFGLPGFDELLKDPKLKRIIDVVKARADGSIAAGEFDAKKVNKGRFQPKVGGDVILDRKFRKKIEEQSILEARNSFKDAVSSLEARTGPQIPSAKRGGGELPTGGRRQKRTTFRPEQLESTAFEDSFFDKGLDLKTLIRPGRSLSHVDVESILSGEGLSGGREGVSSLQPGSINALVKAIGAKNSKAGLDPNLSTIERIAAEIEASSDLVDGVRKPKFVPNSFKIATLTKDLSEPEEFMKLVGANSTDEILHGGNLDRALRATVDTKHDPLGNVAIGDESVGIIQKFLRTSNLARETTGKREGTQLTVKELQEAVELLEEIGLRPRAKRATSSRFADGGKITGPGGPRSDTVPIMASNGEFIMNSDAVKALGVPLMNHINKTGSIPFGALQKFADGGLVGAGGVSAGASSVEVKVNTQEITSAVTAGISSGAKEIKVSLDVPSGGIPLDVSALKGVSLGDNLGAGLRNRMEAVEGSIAALREDANSVIEKVTSLGEKVENQVQTILDKVFGMINEQLNNAQASTGNGVDARMNAQAVAIDSKFADLASKVSEAQALASRALTRALARV